jgi:RHS repeat-associated protein
MIAESDGAATPSSRYYIWGLDLSGTLQGAGGVGGLIAVVETADEPFFACYDANGNITEYVDTNGTVAAYYQYDPYGNIMQASGTKAGEMAYRFSTKYLDAEADMYYYGYRYYNPEIGRWISRDPIEERGGINLFNLLQGDSINYVDPFGLRWLGTVIMAPSVITASNFLEAAGKMNGKFRTDHPVWFNTVSESSSPTDQKDSSCSSCKMYSCKYEKTIEAAGFADIEHGEYSGGDAWDQAYWGKAHARAMQHEMEHAKIAENWVNRVGTETVSATASKCDSSAQLCDKAKKAVDDRLAEFKKLQFGIHANEQKVFEGKDTPLAQQYIAQLMNQYRNQHP